MSASVVAASRFPSGVPGLDEVLQGGIPRGSLILVEGPPGSGKTTIALQFLLQAVRDKERCLLASNAETPEQLKSIVASHGWDLEGVHITELADQAESDEGGPADYTLFPEAEVEIGETLEHLFAEVERLSPRLLVLDTISSLRIMAPTPAFHRRQLKRIRDFMAARSVTTVILDEAAATEKDLRSQTLSDGIIELEQIDSAYGADRRRLRVRKLRGCSYLSGAHDFSIITGGLVVYPRLVAQSHESALTSGPLQSGLAELARSRAGASPMTPAASLSAQLELGNRPSLHSMRWRPRHEVRTAASCFLTKASKPI
jgi:circadian clock protein KaiC